MSRVGKITYKELLKTISDAAFSRTLCISAALRTKIGMNEMYPGSWTKSVCFIQLLSCFPLVCLLAQSAARSDRDGVELSVVLNEGGF